MASRPAWSRSCFPVFAAEVAGAAHRGLGDRHRRVRDRGRHPAAASRSRARSGSALAGVASILFGVVILLFPAAGALSLVWLIGSFAIAFGVFLVMLGWRLRRIDELAQIDAAHDYSATSEPVSRRRRRPHRPPAGPRPRCRR